jgi:hypothetical protein
MVTSPDVPQPTEPCTPKIPSAEANCIARAAPVPEGTTNNPAIHIVEINSSPPSSSNK